MIAPEVAKIVMDAVGSVVASMTEAKVRATLPAGSRIARHPEGDGWIVAHPDFAPAWHRLSGEIVPLGEHGQIPPYRCEQPSAAQ